ncbi:MAG: hypothetical protein NWE92_04835 [Candidatus Bathyarchaeota archaeon]|nr:hypothetical protein [Candidatus Bathyarchaeota archaeon]
MSKTASAFAPGAISSFFEIHDAENGVPLTALERMGAIGGGFGLDRGVHTQVTVEEAPQNSIDVSINSVPVPEAKTTKAMINALLSQTNKKFAVKVEHKIEVPIGTGFGTSAGGALTAGIALCAAIDLPLTYNQIGRIAHTVEIQCQTGLGTVSSLTFGGGCILVVSPGAPGICQIDRIPISPDYKIVAGFFKTKIPKTILASPEKKREINGYGKQTLASVLAAPTLQNFLDCCWSFAQKTGFATEGVCQLVDVAKKAGAVGAAQNMIGHAVHAVVHKQKARLVAEAFKEILPSEQVIVSGIDFQGARLIT